MRILIHPLWTNRSLHHCTTYIVLKNWLPRIVKNDPSAFVYVPVPENYTGELVEIEHPRIKLLPRADVGVDQRVSMCTAEGSIIDDFNDLSGRYFADVILTMKPSQISTIMSRIGTGRYRWSIPPAVVSAVMFAIGEKSGFDDVVGHLQSIGLAESDLSVWQGPTSYKRAKELARGVLSSACLKRIEEKKIFGVTGIPTKKIKALAIDPMDKPKKPRIVNYGYSLNSIYGYEETFRIFDYMFAAGRDVKVFITSPSGSLVLWGKDVREAWDKKYQHYFDVTYRLSQDKFWERVSSAHAFLMLANDIETSFSVFEQFQLGLVGVFLDKPYVKEMVYPGYPYIGKNDMEIATMVRHVLDHYYDEDVQAVLKKQKEWIEENMDIDVKVDAIYEEIKRVELERDRKGCTKDGSLVNGMIEMFEGEEVVDYEKWVKIIKEKSKNGLDVTKLKPQSKGRSVFREAMILSGWSDDCQKEDPVFRR